MYPSLMTDASYVPCRILDLLGLLKADDGILIGHICRTMSALFYFLTVLCMAKTIRTLFGRRSELPALLFAASIGALLHHAHLATVNSCFFGTISLALYQFVRTLKRGTEKDFYLSVAACSLACGSKYNALFLFCTLPLLWIFVFGLHAVFSRRFLRCLVVSLLLAPLPFLLTTPYLILDWPRFSRNFYDLCYVEGPKFRSIPDVGAFFRLFWIFCLGFFSPLTTRLLLGSLAAAWLYWLYCLVLSSSRNEFRVRNRLVLQASALLVFTLATFLFLTYRIGIGQSRYFLPAAILLGLSFLLAFFSARQAFASNPLFRFGSRAVLTALLIFNGVNSYAHVVVFPLSPKSRALGVVAAAVHEDPTACIGVISYPGRSPFNLTALANSLDVFLTMESPGESVKTWDQYLDLIAGHFAQSAPRFIVFEDIVTTWTVFLPREFASDYGKRLLYPNPGFAAWEKMLQGLGYKQVKVLHEGHGQAWLRRALGNYYQLTTEGSKGVVYIFERCREVGTDPGHAGRLRARLAERKPQ
jgi:hypothetical protein